MLMMAPSVVWHLTNRSPQGLTASETIVKSNARTYQSAVAAGVLPP